MNVYAILGVLLMGAAACFASFEIGAKVERSTWLAKEVKVQERIIYRDRVIEKEVPTIVTKVVTKTVTVEKEVERVVEIAAKVIPADCVLPAHYGGLLVAAANGRDTEAAGGADAPPAEYGCLETLDATLADLKAGWVNSARLAGLQQWVALATSPPSP